MFSTLLDNFSPFLSNLKLSSTKSLSLEQSEICILGKVKNLYTVASVSVFTNHSQEHSLFFSKRFCKFECSTTADWLNCIV